VGDKVSERAINPNTHRVLYDPDDSRPDYIGLNTSVSADTATTGWNIFNFTYTTTTSKDVTDIKKKGGTWSGRVALFA